MPNTVVLERTIDVHIKALRKKLGTLAVQIETISQRGVSLCACPGTTSKIILLTADGEFGFAMPLLHGVLMFFLLLLQKMLIGNSDCDLCFDLKQLVFHVEDELFR